MEQLELSKIFTKSMIPGDLLKDPEEMFNFGIICMETCMLASLGRYVRDHSGDYREYQEILNHLVSEGVIYEESKNGYLDIIKMTGWEDHDESY